MEVRYTCISYIGIKALSGLMSLSGKAWRLAKTTLDPLLPFMTQFPWSLHSAFGTRAGPSLLLLHLLQYIPSPASQVSNALLYRYHTDNPRRACSICIYIEQIPVAIYRETNI